MAQFYIKCPKCGQELEVQDEWVGMEAECPLCQEKIIIPERPAPTLRLKLREEDKSTFTQPPQNSGYTYETPKKKKKPSVEISKGAIVIFVIAIIGFFCVLLGASFIGFVIAIISMLVARKIRKNMSDAETEQSVFSISTKSFTWSTTVIALIAGFLSIKADFSNLKETSRKIAQTAMCIDKWCENFNLAFRATKYTGHEAACKNNLYLAGTILKQYHGTYKKYPDCEEGDTLDGIIQAYRQKLYEGHDEKPDNSITYHCPLDGKPLCYIGNTSAQDSTIPLAYCPNHKNRDGSYRNVLFADGHTGEGKISLRKKQPVNDKKVSIKTQTQKFENKSAGYSVEIEVSAPGPDTPKEPSHVKETPKKKYNHAYDMLFNKKGAEREEGLRILKEMAASGNAEACKDLATWYSLDERNPQMTFFYFRKGAELNNVLCQSCCGMSYMTGYGVQKNEYEGIRWLIKASNNNDAESQYILYLCYSIGKGCQRNKQEAIKWLKKSASQGYKKALKKNEERRNFLGRKSK